MVEKVKNNITTPTQQSAINRVLSARESGRNENLGMAEQINRPREDPDQVQQPEPQPWHSVVITRVSQVQKTQQVFVEEVEPEEPAVFAGRTMHRKRKVGRVAQGCEHMPRHGNRQSDDNRRAESQSTPRLVEKQLSREGHVDNTRQHRKNHRDQALQQ